MKRIHLMMQPNSRYGAARLPFLVVALIVILIAVLCRWMVWPRFLAARECRIAIEAMPPWIKAIHYLKALKAWPKSEQAREGLLVVIKKGNLGMAEYAVLKRASALAPSDRKLRIAFAHSAEFYGHYEEALAAFQSVAASSNPPDLEAAVGAAESAMDLSRYEKADKWFARVEGRLHESQHYSEWAEIAAMRGDKPRALRLLARAEALADSDSFAYRNIAFVFLMRLGQPKEAIPYLKETLRLRPDDIASLGALGAACYMTGQLREARHYLLTVVADKRAFGDDYVMAGLACYAAGDQVETEHVFNLAKDRLLHSRVPYLDPYCHVGLALCFSHRGRMLQAVEEAMQATDIMTTPNSDFERERYCLYDFQRDLWNRVEQNLARAKQGPESQALRLICDYHLQGDKPRDVPNSVKRLRVKGRLFIDWWGGLPEHVKLKVMR